MPKTIDLTETASPRTETQVHDLKEKAKWIRIQREIDRNVRLYVRQVAMRAGVNGVDELASIELEYKRSEKYYDMIDYVRMKYGVLDRV